MSLAVKYFEMWDIQMYKTYWPLEASERKVRVVPANFCGRGFIYDPRILPGYKKPMQSRKQTPRKENAKF